MVDFTKIKHKIREKDFVKKLLVILAVGIVFMILGEFGQSNKREEQVVIDDIKPLQSQGVEKDMEELLSSIEGAGKVRVMVTYKTSKEVIREFEKKEVVNNTKEDDGGGGKKMIQQREITESVMFEENNGSRKAVVRYEKEPEIRGVVVVAEGACDDKVRRDLQMAVKVLTDVPLHRISVLAMDSK